MPITSTTSWDDGDPSDLRVAELLNSRWRSIKEQSPVIQRHSYEKCKNNFKLFPDAPRALAQAARVLKPNGKISLYDPYRYNPYRRLSEVRDYFRGTIERVSALAN
jgi:DNA modification methylase